MVVTWTVPGALWLLLAVPLVWLANFVARTNFNRRQRWLQTAIRSVLLAAVALALARPVVSTTSSRQSIVYVVDVSHSVSGRAVEETAKTIDDLSAALRPAHSRIVVFGTTAAVVSDTAALRRVAQVDPGTSGRDLVDRRGTDLERALDAGRGELAAGYIPRLVLFSDGQPSAGNTSAAVARLAAAHVPISVAPLSVRFLSDTWVDTLELPDRVAAGATFAATVGVGSQRDVAAVVELRSNGKVLARQTISVPKGMSRVGLSGVVDAPGAHVLEASVKATGDPLTANDTLERGVWADARAKVLYVEGTPASAHYLSGALTESGFDVTVRRPAGLPGTRALLEPYDVVVLSDVERAAIPDASMSALSEWVEQGGGGLLVAGGEAVFGERGYKDTLLEKLTPVTFERRDEPEVALIIVLDRSWSMAGASMDLTKVAAQAAVDVMTDQQAVGVITFNDKFDWDVTLRNVGKNRDFIRKKIAGIQASGPTLIFPAVEQAYLSLRTAKARAKHVILLSDGRSYPDDYEGLVKKMASARITVSTVSVGPSADPELLRNIATWGSGRAYQVMDAKEVPQIFVKEAKNALTPAFDEKAVTAIVKTPGFLAGMDLTRLPPLKGRTATVLKDTALEVAATEDGDPLLAFWPVGLGRTAVWASDVKDRWAANWIRWRGYGPFFTAVVRALERRRPAAAQLDVTPGPIQGGARSMAIAVEARDPNGRYRDLLHPVVQVRNGEKASSNVTLRQVAPGRYEANVVADAAQPFTATMTGAESRLVVSDAAVEYRFRPADDALLQSIASATGGTFRPTAPALANTSGDHRIERRPVWGALIAIALCLWLIDLVFRRVRVFEPGVSLDTLDSPAPGVESRQGRSRAS